jgi:hypothetical protein
MMSLAREIKEVYVIMLTSLESLEGRPAAN